MNEASLGDKALSNSDWQSAINHYTRALIEHPRAPAYYIKRATAYTRRRNRLTTDNNAAGAENNSETKPDFPDFEAALQDAETALVLARERGKRELILDAQMRRAVALFHLGRYGDAKFVFGILREKIPVNNRNNENGDRSEELQAAISHGGEGGGNTASKRKHEQELTIWEIKLEGTLKKLQNGSEQANIAVKEYPDLNIPEEEEIRKTLKAQLEGTAKRGSSAEEDQRVTTDNSPETQEARTAIDRPSESASFATGLTGFPAPNSIRHEWYQSNDTIVVTIYAKGISNDKLGVDIQATSISVEFPLPSNSTFAFTLDPLYHPIKPTESKVTVLSTKIEISLRKQTPGIKWSSLESTGLTTSQPLKDSLASLESAASEPSASARLAAIPHESHPSTASTGPIYPTSSRKGVKDWDKLATDLTAKKKKGTRTTGKKVSEEEPQDRNGSEGEGGKSDTESIDSDYGGDPVDGFFKKLYANADDDTRRAMVKSYYESQGTALSTNWDEVGKGKVEVRPGT